MKKAKSSQAVAQAAAIYKVATAIRGKEQSGSTDYLRVEAILRDATGLNEHRFADFIAALHRLLPMTSSDPEKRAAALNAMLTRGR